MIVPSLLPRILLRLLLVCLALASVQVRGDLSWTPETGWRLARGMATGITNPSEREEALALMNRSRREQEVDSDGAALRLYRKVIRRYGTSAFAPEAHYQSAQIRIRRRQWTKAFNHLQQIVEEHPDYPRFGAVIRQQYSIADALSKGARLRLFWVVPGFRSPEQAVEYFEQVVENAPYSEVAPHALLNAARLQIRRRQIDEATDLFDRFISEYPRHPQAPEAYFGLADAYENRVQGPEYDQGATREAMSYYEDFALLHPEHPRASEAEKGVSEMRDMLAQSRVVIGNFYFFYRNNFHAARVFYNEAITISPDSASAEEARTKLAQVERRAEARQD